jgi:hypothetical protein
MVGIKPQRTEDIEGTVCGYGRVYCDGRCGVCFCVRKSLELSESKRKRVANARAYVCLRLGAVRERELSISLPDTAIALPLTARHYRG